MSGDPNDHPGFLFVAMAGDPVANAAACDAQAQLGYSLIGFCPVGGSTFAVFSRGYGGH
jgi:hypothetical protein